MTLPLTLDDVAPDDLIVPVDDRHFMRLPLRPPVCMQGHNPVLGSPAVLAIAQRLKRTPAQVALRWALQHGQVCVWVFGCLGVWVGVWVCGSVGVWVCVWGGVGGGGWGGGLPTLPLPPPALALKHAVYETAPCRRCAVPLLLPPPATCRRCCLAPPRSTAWRATSTSTPLTSPTKTCSSSTRSTARRRWSSSSKRSSKRSSSRRVQRFGTILRRQRAAAASDGTPSRDVLQLP